MPSLHCTHAAAARSRSTSRVEGTMGNCQFEEIRYHTHRAGRSKHEQLSSVIEMRSTFVMRSCRKSRGPWLLPSSTSWCRCRSTLLLVCAALRADGAHVDRGCNDAACRWWAAAQQAGVWTRDIMRWRGHQGEEGPSRRTPISSGKWSTQTPSASWPTSSTLSKKGNAVSAWRCSRWVRCAHHERRR
jgi:hypothetical protein